MSETAIPNFVDDVETIARILFSPYMVEDGEILPTAYSLREQINESYVSVIRSIYCKIKDNDYSFLRMPANNTIAGYAEVAAGACRTAGIDNFTVDVAAHSKENNPFHAGIHYCDGGAAVRGKCLSPYYLPVRQNLANISTYFPFQN